MNYPADYPDPKLQGKTYAYAVEILGIKEKKSPELNDEFAKDVSEAQTVDELRTKIRENVEAARAQQQNHQTKEKLLADIVKRHDFPVPQALVERQMDTRLERTVRSLAAQGVDPRAVNVDWVSLRRKQRGAHRVSCGRGIRPVSARSASRAARRAESRVANQEALSNS